MAKRPRSLRVRLFYSYSHKDSQHRAAMEKTLASLKRNGFLEDWSDEEILPGRSISEAINERLPSSDIIAFLFSPDFLDSEECMREWDRASQLAETGRLVFRVPIIVRDCAWQDFLAEDDVKALPRDGKAIKSYSNTDSAWHEVYNGIKGLVEAFRTTFTPKAAFFQDFSAADIPSTRPISLDDIFVFPWLVKNDYTSTSDPLRESLIHSVQELLDHRLVLIYGQDRSGKSALGKHIFLSLVNNEEPVLFADFSVASGGIGANFLRNLYETQFNGDYNLWLEKPDKTLIIDNMAERRHLIEFAASAPERFSRVILFVSSDVFHSFLKDETTLAEFQEVSIGPFTFSKQEALIRKRLAVLDRGVTITDGFIDKVEDRVNSIIISNKIVPRYPFFILSILQTYDGFMPRDISITSYGHCYYVFIIASLVRAGVSKTDDDLNSCFNFAEHLAFELFRNSLGSECEPFDFGAFVAKYRDTYILRQGLLKRLTHPEYGIVDELGQFRSIYMYYFFLGKVLASDAQTREEYLGDLCERSYEERNYLILLFAIHHARDEEIIEYILSRTTLELGQVSVARLDEEETARFAGIVSALPESVLSGQSVEEERRKERRQKDAQEDHGENGGDKQTLEETEELQASMLRILRNNKILGQVLRTQYGKLEKEKIESIVEAIADSSFRVVNLFLSDEEEIRQLALHIKAKRPDADLAEVQKVLRFMSFIWTMGNIEDGVEAVNIPNIREAVRTVVAQNNSPIYDIFGYFNELDSGEELTKSVRESLAALQKKHKDEFVKRVLSIRTQMYMNTHRSDQRVEQSICALLGVKYQPRRMLVE